jgi:hypothetical protein
MISLDVEKGIPLPAERKRYPYASMDVGDSFIVYGGKMQVVCNANYRAFKKLGFKFIARCEPEGVRVWRIN